MNIEIENSKKIKYKGHPNYINLIINESTGLMSTINMIKQFTEDPYRTQLIINEAAD